MAIPQRFPSRYCVASLRCSFHHHGIRLSASTPRAPGQVSEGPNDPFAELVKSDEAEKRAQWNQIRQTTDGGDIDQDVNPFAALPKKIRSSHTTWYFEDAMERLEVEDAGEELDEGVMGDIQAMTHQGSKPLPRLELPTDPRLLKALPAGFRNMSDEDQQKELWIVKMEDELKSKLPPAVVNTDTSRKLPYSPTQVLAKLLRRRRSGLNEREWHLTTALACNRSLRFPVLTLQAFLRRQCLLARSHGVQLEIEQYLETPQEWKYRMDELEKQTGITEADIKQWLWILAPKSGDEQWERFFSSQCRKPLFLVLSLLAKDKKIREPTTLVRVVQYIRENYVFIDRPLADANHPKYETQGRHLTWFHFLVVLHRLVWHTREQYPAAYPLLASLVADYIETIPADSEGNAFTGTQARSAVLNKALSYLAWPARTRPLDHMEYNWAAQQHLLQLAVASDPPLVIVQNGYRSIRSVLIALGKSKEEIRNVERLVPTWPPFRRTVDGIDERRPPEEFLSRSGKAGLLARAAGYEDENVDEAQNALSGSTLGESPTIQTRSLQPEYTSEERASENIYAKWVAQIRATRNAREAWKVFQTPPQPGLHRTAQVYGEMFEKLFAPPVADSPFLRPGDVTEAFPVHDGNLTDFEIARITPPTPEALYNRMVYEDMVRPTGRCLEVLVRNAPSKGAALRYLSDSPYGRFIQALARPFVEHDDETMKLLAYIPVRVFNAYIELLCRLHKRPHKHALEEWERDRTDATTPWSFRGYIREAVILTVKFHQQHPYINECDKVPWNTVMQALAGPKILYSLRGHEYNLIETLMAFLNMYEGSAGYKGIDPISFEALCVMIRKVMKLATLVFKAEGGEPEVRRWIPHMGAYEGLLLRGHWFAVRSFALLTEQVPFDTPLRGGPLHRDNAGSQHEEAQEDVGDPPGMPRFNVFGRPLYRYMVALACVGDRREMVRTMDWLLDSWEYGFVRETAKSPEHLDYYYAMRTIDHFVEMGRRLVESTELERLQLRLQELRRTKNCTWYWPERSEDGEEEPPLPPRMKTDIALIERWGSLRKRVNAAYEAQWTGNETQSTGHETQSAVNETQLAV
jgi:DNA (cytosine-5)-methyltransferase 1